MKKNIEELLTYDILRKNDIIYLSLPVQNLINPTFSLDKNNLYISLTEHQHSYIIKKLPDNVLLSILAGTCYLKENLSIEFEKQHLIKI